MAVNRKVAMNLKKYYPFIFPAIALIIVAFLAFRWYNLRTQRDQVAEQSEVQIENLTEEEQQIVQGTDGAETVDLEGEEGQTGEVRYSLSDGRVLFSVNANLEDVELGGYQVWLQPKGADQMQKAFILDRSKGGLMGSGAVSQDLLPFEVIVSREENLDDDTLEQEVLKSKIEVQGE